MVSVSHSAIFPRKCKVSSQILIKQHLNAHYKSIQSAKASIDNSTPYSFINNPTTRGYRKSSRRICRQPLSGRPETNGFCSQNVINTFSDDPEVDEIVRKFLLDDCAKYTEPFTYNEHHLQSAGGENAFGKHTCSDRGPASLRKLEGDCFSNKTVHRRQSFSKDVMDIHHNKFTNPKLFSPRTIKSNASSKLIGLRCYNPPKRVVRICQPDSKVILDVKPVIRSKKSISRRPTNSDLGIKEKAIPKDPNTNHDHVIYSHSEKRLSTYSTKQSNILSSMLLAPQKRISLTYSQKLPISDGSHNFGKVNQWLSTLPSNNSVHKPEVVLSNSHDEEDFERLITEKKIVKDNMSLQMINKPIEREISVENLKKEVNYLKFISSVTEDVLTRGVLTDKNVNTILLEHATLNEYGLSTEQIRRGIQHIRSQLNITAEDATKFNTDMNHVLNANSPRIPPYSQSYSNDTCGIDSGRTQEQEKPVISYTTTLDIKPVSKSTLPPPVPSKEGQQPAYHRTTTSISIKPNQSSSPLKHVAQYQEIFHDTDSHREISRNLSDILHMDKSSNQVIQDAAAQLTKRQSISSSNKLAENQYKKYSTEKNTSGNLNDQEDTLNDQHATLSSSVSNTTGCTTTIANSYPVNEINSSLTQYDEIYGNFQGKDIETLKNRLKTEHEIDDNKVADVDDEQKCITHQNRVKFASEAEFFSPSYYSEQTTSVSSITDITHVSSATTSTTNTNANNINTITSELLCLPGVATVSPRKSPSYISNLNKQDVSEVKLKECTHVTKDTDDRKNHDEKEVEDQDNTYKEDFVSDCEE
ncbi:unnamed protein product [Heterobilharzia americana]|nr:unnamed protein product [Heterobilharzia americana]